jgi:hypothetical protein
MMMMMTKIRRMTGAMASPNPVLSARPYLRRFPRKPRRPRNGKRLYLTMMMISKYGNIDAIHNS